jgi:hypothetical protein
MHKTTRLAPSTASAIVRALLGYVARQPGDERERGVGKSASACRIFFQRPYDRATNQPEAEQGDAHR